MRKIGRWHDGDDVRGVPALDHTLAVESKRAIRPKGKFTVVEGRDCKLRFLPYRDELLSIAYSQLAAIARMALTSGSV